MQRYELLGRNGAGANSTVFKCRDNSSGTVVAVKKMEGAALSQILQEAAIMRICAHKHCVELLEAYQGSSSGIVYLVMDNIEHSLSRELLLNPRGVPLNKAKLITFQLAQALDNMHSKQVAHGDMKPANILLTAQYNVKLCDFGSATTPVLMGRGSGTDGAASGTPSFLAAVAAGQGSLCTGAGAGGAANTWTTATTTTAAASRWYCAPESLLGMQGSTAASDIWALGCILAELVTGKPLMPGSEEELHQLCWVLSMIGHLSEAQERVLKLLPWDQRAKLDQSRARGPLLERIPKLAACPELLQTLRACLNPDPAQRPTAQQLQSMPFFEDLRQALRQGSEDEAVEAQAKAEEEATAAAQAQAGHSSPTAGAPSSPLPPLPRRTSSGDMDVDDAVGGASTGTTASPDPAAPCPMSSPPSHTVGGQASGAQLGGQPLAAAAAAPPPPLPRRVSGVQAAAPLRPAPRARVSALTATIRGNPFDGDGGYVDLMPQVLRLVACWQEQAISAEDRVLGPIALAARRASSMSPAASLTSALSSELLGLGGGSGRWTCAAVAGAGPTATSAMTAAAAAATCTTPIAAAAGGCGSTRPPSSTPSPRATASSANASPAAAAAASASPMDCSASPAAVTGPPHAAAAAKPTDMPLSASVGATPYIAQARGLAPCADAAATAAAAAAVKPTAAHLRSRAIINRARRHTHLRESCSGSVPSSFLGGSPSSCPRASGGLGASATLLQQELAAAAAAGGVISRLPTGCNLEAGRATSGGHAVRRSYADLSDLASVAEYAPLACDTPPEVKRRRGLGLYHGGSVSHASATSLGSLVTEVSLGSLPEHEPMFLSRAAGGRRLRRSSSGGSGVFATGSPIRLSAPQMPLQHHPNQLLFAPGAVAAAAAAAAATGARTVSKPQPISARGRNAAVPAGRNGGRGLAASASNDALNMAMADVFLRG